MPGDAQEREDPTLSHRDEEEAEAAYRRATLDDSTLDTSIGLSDVSMTQLDRYEKSRSPTGSAATFPPLG